jgi:hypothetical protein
MTDFRILSGSAGIFDIVKKRICLAASQEGACRIHRGRQGLTALPLRQILHKNWSFLSMTSATGLPSDGRTHPRMGIDNESDQAT